MVEEDPRTMRRRNRSCVIAGMAIHDDDGSGVVKRSFDNRSNRPRLVLRGNHHTRVVPVLDGTWSSGLERWELPRQIAADR
jgi:hypothetical protein